MANYTMPRYIVYKVTNSVNGKSYIGITTKGFDKRWKTHIYDAKKKGIVVFHKALLKYGIDKFTHEILEECPDFTTLLLREKELIKEHNTLVPDGYNMVKGGLGHYGIPLTADHKAKISKAHTGKRKSFEMRQRMREVALTRSMEHLSKISEALKGKHPSEETKQKIRNARANQYFSPEAIEKRSSKLRGFRHTEKSKANMSLAQRGRLVSNLHREKIRDTLQALTNEQAAIIKFNALKLKQKEYAVLFKVSPQTINGIVKGRQYSYITVSDLPEIYKG